MFKLSSTRVVIALAAAVVIVLVALCLAPRGKHMPGLTVSDARIKALDCRVEYGSNFVYHPQGLKVFLRRYGIPIDRLTPTVTPFDTTAETGTNAVVLIFAFEARFYQQTYFVAEMSDGGGRVFPMRFSSMSLAHRQGQTWSAGEYFWALDGPTPPPMGEYEFRILSSTNGTVLARYKTRLDFK